MASAFEDHLRRALEDAPLGGDIDSKFADDCMLVTSFGTFHGRDGVWVAAQLLDQALPNARYRYEECVRHGGLCFLGWCADADGASVDDGTDSFLIEDGKIKIMTIHYTPQPVDKC